MAIHARLVAPQQPTRREWPWHKAKWSSMPVHILGRADRRMEAENYLSSGYGLRLAIQERAVGWRPFYQLARVWQPSRLKGIQVSREYGTPFLAATQIFDLRPIARKWLSLERTDDAAQRFVKRGTILVTCSGLVGRSTLAHAPQNDVLITHDLLRVEPLDNAMWGWLYAYLRSSQARAIMTGAQYGHIIKHLEISHLDALPVPVVHKHIADKFFQLTQQILKLRDEAHLLAKQADERFASAIGPIKPSADTGFAVKSSEMFLKRRRLEASYHAPLPTAILKRFNQARLKTEPLSKFAQKVWWMTRFKRFYGEDGIPYLSADELFSINSPETKRILVDPKDNHPEYFVKEGWIVMACSGQIYGLNGAAALMTKYHENTFFSHDLIRIIPNPEKIRSGYLLVTLTHPTLGRPLLIRAAYGTSIPHLDPKDVSDFPVVRLDASEENAIADLAEKAASSRALADTLERQIAAEAGVLIDEFLSGKMRNFVTSENTQ